MAKRQARKRAPTRVIGIGASAGGLEALRQLFGRLRPDTGHAFVVLQHLAPSQTGELAKLLAATTAMAVVDLESGVRVQPNVVYIVPPHKSAILQGDTLVLKGMRGVAQRHHPIDALFNSLAEVLAERAVGVVLSGTGNDGSAGLHAIHQAGGLVCAQEPSTAQFDDMPRNAITVGLAEIVRPPAELADELGALAERGPSVAVAHAVIATPPTDRILEQLREASGIDFTSYKRTTIERRLARRLAMLHLASLADYSAYLDKHPEEAATVYEDLLIHVTEFFRDGEVLETAIARVLPDLIRDKPGEAPIRVWVPGCSTGEEVYSLAMLLVEKLADDRPIQMFGSDLSERAIDTARRGVYPTTIAAQVSAERLERFFLREENGYRIKREIRERCVFVRHDLVVDPPFSKLDLISCRNVFIYLAPTLQKRVLPIFHYSLNDPGFLLLGSAETIAGFEHLFATVDGEARLYSRKLGTRSVLTFSTPGQLGRQPWRRPVDAVRSLVDIQRDVDHVLLARYSPPCVIVNEQFDVLHFRGRTSTYLEQPPGQPQVSVLRLAREGLGAELTLALERARRTDKPVRRESVGVGERGSRTVDVEVIPLRGPVDTKRHYLIVFEEPDVSRPATSSKAAKRPRASDETTRLRQELASTKEYLHSIVSQHLATSEELSLMNEELQSTNEELQSTNEELQTAKEELQSTNEELRTVNEELASNNERLNQVNDDLVNVLASVDLAIIIVDNDRRVRRFTPRARSVMKLLPGDVGRPIADLMPSVAMPELDHEIEVVIQSLTPRESEVCHPDGTWYRMQIRPYRTLDNKVNGATLSFVDITALRGAREHAAAIVETVPTPLAVLDDQLRLQSTNRAFDHTFGAFPLGTDLAAIDGFGIGPLPARLREVVETGTAFDELDVGTAEDRRMLRVGARPMPAVDGAKRLLVGVADVTERRRLEHAREKSERERKAFLDAVSHELRTPLSAVLLWAEALRDMPEGDPNHARAVETIVDCAHTEAQLIDDLIDVALARSTALAIKVEPTKPGQIVREIIDVMRPDAEEKHLVVEIDLDEKGSVVADPRRLRQIARGLISNAIRFTPDGGTVRVELSTLRGAMELRVRNSGPGIAPDFIPHLFAPFARGDDHALGGLGLGLSLVRHFVERHGGTIDVVSSDAERGTTFTVRIPGAQGARA